MSAGVPDGLDSASAAALPCAGMTAYQAIVRRLHVRSGDTVLVTGGNGGVGGFAIQLVRAAGARVISTASSRFERLRVLGAAETVDYRDPDMLAAIRGLAGPDGIDAIVDTVGEGSATELLPLLNHAGGIACIAGRAVPAAVRPFGIAPSVHEIALGAAYSAGDDKHVRNLGTMLAELMDRVATGQLDPMVSRVIASEEIPDALEEIGRRHVAGKIVARWP